MSYGDESGIQQPDEQPNPLVRWSRQRRPGTGRSITPAGLKVIEELASEGRSYAAVARALGIDTKTLRRLRNEQEGVQAAYEAGRARIDSEVTDYFLEQIRKRTKQSLVAAIYFSKAKLGWRENDPPADHVQQTVIVLPKDYDPRTFLEQRRVIDVEVSGAPGNTGGGSPRKRAQGEKEK